MNQRPMSVLKKFESLPIGSVGMSVITYGELEFGALRSNNSSKAKAILYELMINTKITTDCRGSAEPKIKP
jgi:tRNA(fMet)-specific endonuclease VapC